jgi:methionyl-tRNA formyltransferase
MEGLRTTGVTLQTLDEKSFDQGTILAQTPQNGLNIPKPHSITYQELHDFITPKAAQMLVQGIRDKVFVPPLQSVGWYDRKTLIPAPKITAADRQIDWAKMAPAIIDRNHRALGRLWNHIYTYPPTTKRVVFEDMEMVPTPPVLAEFIKKHSWKHLKEAPEAQNLASEIKFMVYAKGEDDRAPQFYVDDGDAIIISSLINREMSTRVKEVTVEGESKKAASKAMQLMNGRGKWHLTKGSGRHIGVQLPGTQGVRIRKFMSKQKLV